MRGANIRLSVASSVDTGFICVHPLVGRGDPCGCPLGQARGLMGGREARPYKDETCKR